MREKGGSARAILAYTCSYAYTFLNRARSANIAVVLNNCVLLFPSNMHGALSLKQVLFPFRAAFAPHLCRSDR